MSRYRRWSRPKRISQQSSSRRCACASGARSLSATTRGGRMGRVILIFLLAAVCGAVSAAIASRRGASDFV